MVVHFCVNAPMYDLIYCMPKHVQNVWLHWPPRTLDEKPPATLLDPPNTTAPFLFNDASWFKKKRNDPIIRCVRKQAGGWAGREGRWASGWVGERATGR